jgi:antitoxin component YwqK of YwqJK toxin-antitoxin module
MTRLSTRHAALTCLSVLFLALLPGIGSNAQVPKSPNTLGANGLRTGRWTIPLDSAFNPITDAAAAKYYRVITYKHGKPSGPVYDYYPSGALQGKGVMYSETPRKWQGLYTAYYETGQVRRTWMYEKGLREGATTGWYKNGRKKQEYVYRHDALEGTAGTWYENGVRADSTEYHNGKIDGFNVGWDEQGRMVYNIQYKDGRMNGLALGYYPDGTKKCLIHYVDDKRRGEEICWTEEGKEAMGMNARMRIVMEFFAKVLLIQTFILTAN